ncbi:undecaprenyl-phosphate glucose phosphotransferase [Clostridium formicaceticum]|uniref:UDP-glucose:undecaprenyl-phosphate glucose-1-phosphate transferase n=1 Tax=Clostridium formicaceticum TaxID=1497 RepID=A0AAC9RFP2_9CLOT|nr:undecaprenyl-phosphate glucose phosphotransferase [Clostridium formicaceticum]AOY75540.1 undecaprenyl-phosphate glucose phosphotransferase [Clostridium formicaceticum]ARE85834.1 UDP-glucose:undecaprenyl-phosphate glucose-1-phosphate transferase [Clostridium formicaceticum]
MIKENQKILNRLLIIFDAVSIMFSLMLAWWIRFRSGWIYVDSGYLSLREYLLPVLIIMPIYIIIYSFFRLYTPYRFKNVFEELFNIIKSNIMGLLILVLILFLFKEIHYSRYLLFIFALCSISITTVERIIIRLILRRIRKKGYNLKHVLIVGFSELTVELLRRIDKNKQWGYNVIGILDDNKKLGYKVKEKEVIGRNYDLEYYLSTKDIDEVFVTLNIKEYEKLQWVIGICEKSGVRTQIIPDYYKYIPSRPYVEEVDGLPIINIRHVPLDHVIYKVIKRCIDVIGSLIALVIFSPIMLLTVGMIKFTSPGPVLFKQKRVGLNRKNFNMYKFRSMHVQKEEEEKVQWTTKEDPRRTKFGTFIRKTSIDELPQLFNVLKGDMSLVGPRPERPYFVEKFKEEIPKYMIKHQVRPGITGWAQVNGWRGDTSIKKRIECDLYYIENWSLFLDIKILLLTVFKGFVNKNAY